MKKIIWILLLVLISGCRSDEPPRGTKVRPQDYPAFIKPLDSAENVVYSTPENKDAAEGTYTLTYYITEEYPPENTRSAIEHQLSSAGFVRAKYPLYGQLQNRDQYYGWDSKNIHSSRVLTWGEYWIRKDKDELILLVYTYRYKIKTKIPPKLFVSILYHTDRAELSELVKRYKEFYPRENWEKPSDQINFLQIEENETNN